MQSAEMIKMNKPQSLLIEFTFLGYSDPRHQECSHEEQIISIKSSRGLECSVYMVLSKTESGKLQD